MQAEVSRSLDQMNTSLTSFTQKVGEQGANATTSAFQGGGAARHGQPAGGNSPGLCRVQHQ